MPSSTSTKESSQTPPDSNPVPPSFTNSQALILTRILWAASLFFTLIITIAASVYAAFYTPDTPTTPNNTLFIIALALTLLAIPLGLFFRGEAFKKHWRRDVITPTGYITGSIIVIVACELAAIFAAVVIFLNQRLFPELIPAIPPILILTLIYPNGRAMIPNASTPY